MKLNLFCVLHLVLTKYHMFQDEDKVLALERWNEILDSAFSIVTYLPYSVYLLFSLQGPLDMQNILFRIYEGPFKVKLFLWTVLLNMINFNVLRYIFLDVKAIKCVNIHFSFHLIVESLYWNGLTYDMYVSGHILLAVAFPWVQSKFDAFFFTGKMLFL